ncbi:MAG: hypothetical protein AAFZ99_06565 [Pseudomonadota bacterium]
MGRDKSNEDRTEQFTKWVLNHHRMPAWKALSFPARDAYYHLQVRCFAETAQKKDRTENNNGAIFRSPRKLAEDMGCSARTAMAALADLQAKGWIVCTKLPQLGDSGNGTTALFRLTMMEMGKGSSRQAPTKEPAAWREGQDHPVLAYHAYLPKSRKGRIKNITPHPNRMQAPSRIGRREAPKEQFPAPNSDAEKHQNQTIPAPNSDEYLITISPSQTAEEAEVIDLKAFGSRKA